MIKFSGVAAGEACTVVLRGATSQMVDEADRSLHDALSVLSQTVKESGVCLGGGCSEMLMANRVDEAAKKTVGKQALAVEAFAKALRQLPTILADNAGLDSADLVSKLRAAHYEGQSDAGLGQSYARLGASFETLSDILCDRLVPGHHRLHERSRCDRVLQAQATSGDLRFRSERNGAKGVRHCGLAVFKPVAHSHFSVLGCRDNVLRSAPRRREGH